MRFRKSMMLASVLMACLIMTAQSVRSTTIPGNTITFTDIAANDAVTVTSTPATRLTTLLGCGTALVDVCGVTLAAPTGYHYKSSTFDSIAIAGIFTYLIGETSQTSGNVSDDLDALSAFLPSILTKTLAFKFLSDLNANPAGLGVCTTLRPCDNLETGLPGQLAGTITWTPDTTTLPPPDIMDTLLFQSDLGETPEPASLILFGSGLAIAGGLLRRRRRLVPSV